MYICFVISLEGGIVQQRKRMATLQKPPINCRLAEWLVSQWAWGFFSAPKVQEIASMSLEATRQVVSNCIFPGVLPEHFPNLKDLELLAGIGDDGKYPRNMHRDLKQILGSCPLEAGTSISLRVNVLKSKGATRMNPEDIMLPHDTLSALELHYPAAFKEHVLPDDVDLEEWWDALEDHPSLAKHPIKADPNWKKKTIPLSLHGDGVPVTGCGKVWAKSSMIFSFKSLVGRGSTIQTNYLILSIMTCLLATWTGGSTMESILKCIADSFELCLKGVLPNGKKISLNGYKYMIFLLQGDLEHFQDVFGLARFNSKEPCFFCPANSSSLPWRDFRPKLCLWVSQLYSTNSWRPRFKNASVMLKVSGTSVWSIIPDVLHCKYLGTDMYFLASVLWLLAFKLLPAGPQENLNIVWQSLERYYKAHPSPHRYNNLKVSMFCPDPDSPFKKMAKLKGRGAEIKVLVPALHVVWQEFMTKGNPQHEEIKQGLFFSATMDQILDAHKFVPRLPDFKAREFEHAIWGFLTVQNSLGSFYPAEGCKLFDITPKSHYLAHLGLMARFINPRLGICFAGEDFMGKVKMITASSARANTVYKVTTKTACKYRFGLHYMLKGSSLFS